VEAHVFEQLARLIDQYRLDCFRLDYNSAPGEGGERRLEGSAGQIWENTLWRYYEALYRVMDRLRRRYPQLLFENCSSGGGRMDLGIMSRFHWTQATDQWEPQATLKIINGLTLALPPEQVMTLVGAISFDGVADLDFMLRIGLFGKLCVSGVYPSVDEIHQPTLARWQHAVRLYQDWVRPMLGHCRLYHHTPTLSPAVAGEWCVLEMVSADRRRAMIGIWQLPGAPAGDYVVYPGGLQPGWDYTLTYDNTQLQQSVSGFEAMRHGLRVHTGAPGMSELLLLRTSHA
jgi:alpha-galactosidase